MSELERAMEDLEVRVDRLAEITDRIRRVGNDVPRYRALRLTERLVDRGDVMKAVPLAVIEAMQEAADVINFFLGQMQAHSAHMDGQHRYRFRSDGWPMTHCIGPTPEDAVANTVKAVSAEKAKPTFTRATNE